MPSFPRDQDSEWSCGNRVRNNADEGVLLSALLAMAGRTAIANRPITPPPEPSALCPPVVEEFLEAVGLFPELPDYAQPLVVIDIEGHPLDCLPRTLTPDLHAQAVAFLHQFTIFMAQDQGGAPICQIGEARLQDTTFISLILSYDLAQMKGEACLQQVRQSLELLRDRSPLRPLTQPPASALPRNGCYAAERPGAKTRAGVVRRRNSCGQHTTC